MPLPPAMAVLLRELGHDAVHAGEVGLHRAPDDEILTRAAQESRIVVTADLDFPRLLSTAERASTSVILFRGGDFDDTAAFSFMRRALKAMGQTGDRQFILSVDRVRIRRHWL